MNFLKNRGFWGILVLLALGAVTAAVLAGLPPLQLTPVWHTLFSIVFSVFPGLLWLYFFYLQDRYEREPHVHMLGMFALGMLMAYGFSMNVEKMFAQSHAGIFSGNLANLTEAVLVFGCIHELTKFLVVRYTVFYSSEFNEPADGVIYTIAVSLGFASAYNISYLNSLEAINMAVVPIRVVEFYLVNAVVGGFMGYFIGRAKFESRRREILMLSGFILATILSGVYDHIADSLHNLDYNVWKSLAFSGIVVLTIYGVMYYLLRKSLELSPFKPK